MSDEANIVAFRQPCNDHDPHIQGAARCIECGHVWQAVAPVGTVGLECPACKTERGAFVGMIPPDSELVRRCDCGNDLFFVLPDGVLCARCGTMQLFN